MCCCHFPIRCSTSLRCDRYAPHCNAQASLRSGCSPARSSSLWPARHGRTPCWRARSVMTCGAIRLSLCRPSVISVSFFGVKMRWAYSGSTPSAWTLTTGTACPWPLAWACIAASSCAHRSRRCWRPTVSRHRLQNPSGAPVQYGWTACHCSLPAAPSSKPARPTS